MINIFNHQLNAIKDIHCD